MALTWKPYTACWNVRPVAARVVRIAAQGDQDVPCCSCGVYHAGELQCCQPILPTLRSVVGAFQVPDLPTVYPPHLPRRLRAGLRVPVVLLCALLLGIGRIAFRARRPASRHHGRLLHHGAVWPGGASDDRLRDGHAAPLLLLCVHGHLPLEPPLPRRAHQLLGVPLARHLPPLDPARLLHPPRPVSRQRPGWHRRRASVLLFGGDRAHAVQQARALHSAVAAQACGWRACVLCSSDRRCAGWLPGATKGGRLQLGLWGSSLG
mmetsp:Transcript_4188/g.13498  ORF Transcript_4188/g.13498 Transcript_4188/m.13498 type:complete len:263 (-) Transcript_4188:60-848(-)